MYPAACCAKYISSSTCWRQMSDFFFFNTIVSFFWSSCCSGYLGSAQSVGTTGDGCAQSLVSPSTNQISTWSFYPSPLGRSPATLHHKSFQSVCFGPALRLVTVKASGFRFKQIVVVRSWWGRCGEMQDHQRLCWGWERNGTWLDMTPSTCSRLVEGRAVAESELCAAVLPESSSGSDPGSVN